MEGCSGVGVSDFLKVKSWFWSLVGSLLRGGCSVVVCCVRCSMVSFSFWSIHEASSGLMLGRYSGNWFGVVSSSCAFGVVGLMRMAGWGLTLPVFGGFILTIFGFGVLFLLNEKRCFLTVGVIGVVGSVVSFGFVSLGFL